MEEQTELQRGLAQLNGAVFFLLVAVGSILFSLRSLLLQRQQLTTALRGGDVADCPSPLPAKRAASALVIGSLGFFLSLSLDTLRRAGEGGDELEQRSAQVNALASTLVMGAALLRFYDLLLRERQESEGTEEQLLIDESDDLPAL